MKRGEACALCAGVWAGSGLTGREVVVGVWPAAWEGWCCCLVWVLCGRVFCVCVLVVLGGVFWVACKCWCSGGVFWVGCRRRLGVVGLWPGCALGGEAVHRCGGQIMG